MSERRLSIEREKINRIYTLVDDFEGDDEIKSHLVKYLCILSNGHIEESLRIIYSQYVDNKSHKHVTHYVARDLDGFMNPNIEKILNLAGKFSPNWRKELDKNITDEMKKSINSIVYIKNSLAHGRNASISYMNLKKYWENTIKVLDLIEDQCKKS
jgi:hypothetical protein